MVTAGWAAPAATCFGERATITGSGIIDGTAGSDVIVGSDGSDTNLRLGRGEDECYAARGARQGGPITSAVTSWQVVQPRHVVSFPDPGRYHGSYRMLLDCPVGSEGLPSSG